MTNIGIFEVAARNKLRFEHKGLLTVEDLWQLDVTELDTVFKKLNAQLKEVKEESLLNSKTSENRELDVKIEIVKHIVEVKLREAKQSQQAQATRVEKQKIMEILSSKEDEALHDKTPEELREMLTQLD